MAAACVRAIPSSALDISNDLHTVNVAISVRAERVHCNALLQANALQILQPVDLTLHHQLVVLSIHPLAWRQ